MSYALDGHESDSEEKTLLKSYDNRIALHREIWETIIGDELCSDADAVKEEYIRAGRFGSEEAYDTRLIQDYLGHKNIRHTVRYTRTAAIRFENLWR
jgi:hypothetical protein